MTQRLLERELRAASITSSAPLERLSTQASNFSLCRRSAALAVTDTVSIPNCRKHSFRRERCGSLKPTKAARAVFLRGRANGARTAATDFSIVKALSIVRGKTPLSKSIVAARWSRDNDPKDKLEKAERTLLI